MLIVLSPAKSLDVQTPPHVTEATQPDGIAEAAQLIKRLRELSPQDLAALMGISDKLAALNVARFASWRKTFTTENAKQAVLMFNGDVYEGLDASTLDAKALHWAQAHVRILSGLYGVLRPLDLMQAYRLEMGTRLANERGKDLYAYWGDRIARRLNAALAELPAKERVVVNCASEEYFKSVDRSVLASPVMTPVFEERKGGAWKIVSFHAKRARGLMARYAIVQRARSVEALKAFDLEGYAFDAAASTDTLWRFRRAAA